MKHVYVVYGDDGHYDSSIWLVRAFADKIEAEEFAAKCKEYAATRPPIVERYYEDGFDMTPADWAQFNKEEPLWKSSGPDKTDNMEYRADYRVVAVEFGVPS